jgi:hypothetical protein
MDLTDSKTAACKAVDQPRAGHLSRNSLKTDSPPSSTHRTFWPGELAQNATSRALHCWPVRCSYPMGQIIRRAFGSQTREDCPRRRPLNPVAPFRFLENRDNQPQSSRSRGAACVSAERLLPRKLARAFLFGKPTVDQRVIDNHKRRLADLWVPAIEAERGTIL